MDAISLNEFSLWSQMTAKRISKGKKNEKAAIITFVARYNGLQNLCYEIVEWPDENKRSAQQEKSIDAIAQAEGGPNLAIEHTHVVAAHRQLEEAANFQIFKELLERGLDEPFPFHLSLTLFADDLYCGIQRKVHAEKICCWLKAEAFSLLPGRSDFQAVPDTASIGVSKDESRIGFEVNRWIRRPPPDSDDLATSFVVALQHKEPLLRENRRLGAETILLIQSDDVALLAIGLLFQAYQQACSLTKTDHLTQIWLVHTHGHNDWTRIFCFRGPSPVMRASNPEGFREFMASQDEPLVIHGGSDSTKASASSW